MGLPTIARQPLARSAIGSVLTGMVGQAALVVSGSSGPDVVCSRPRSSCLGCCRSPPSRATWHVGGPRAVTFEVARPGGLAGSTLSAAMPIAIAQTFGILIAGVVAALMLSAARPDMDPSHSFALASRSYRRCYGVRLGRSRHWQLPRVQRHSVGTRSQLCRVRAIVAFVFGGANMPLVIAGWTSANSIGRRSCCSGSTRITHGAP